MNVITILAIKIIFVTIILVNLLPVINSHDQNAIDQAASRAIQQITDVGTKAIEHELEMAPIKSVLNAVK